jgi:Ca-activated chloride channel family protein
LNSGAINLFGVLAATALFPAALGVGSFAGAQENPQTPKQTIHVIVDRVNVGVIVTDHSGHFVEGLRREDFRVFDNGVEQPLAGFAPIEEPGQVLLLIEAGPAVYLLESTHVWAANSLLDNLSADDRVAVVKYADLPTALLDFTADKQAALTAFGQLRFNLGFGSLNLCSSVSKMLEWLTSVQGKKTIVLLSTGVDTSSPGEQALAIQQLKVGDVRLLAVSLSGGLQNAQPGGKKKSPATNSSKTRQEFEQADELLKRMAESTGGRAYFPANEKEFNSVYGEIAQLVRHEYSIAFAPPARDGLVHAIEVRVNTPTAKKTADSYRIDHRQAYLAPPPG